MRISDWSSDVCSSDLLDRKLLDGALPLAKGAGAMVARGLVPSPFDPRTRPLNLHQDWMPWAGCLSARRFDSVRSEEHTSELQSLMRISYAVFCLKKKNKYNNKPINHTTTKPSIEK